MNPDWHVFPVDISKRPLTPNGHLDARPAAEWSAADAAVFDSWAVACAASGLCVIDIDPRNGGVETVVRLAQEGRTFPTTLAARTGGGGWHFYYQKPEGEKFRKTLGAGIDVKCQGYVVMPPSPHASGRRYEWANDEPIVELPAWALLLILPMTPNDAHTPLGEASTSFLARAFAAAGMLGPEIDSTRVCCACPWASAHSTNGTESSSVIFAPTESAPLGRFHCSHTSHGHRSFGEVVDMLPIDALAKAIRYDQETGDSSGPSDL